MILRPYAHRKPLGRVSQAKILSKGHSTQHHSAESQLEEFETDAHNELIEQDRIYAVFDQRAKPRKVP